MEIDGTKIIGLPVAYNAEPISEVHGFNLAERVATLKIDLSKLLLPAKLFEGMANYNYSSAEAAARAFAVKVRERNE